MKTALAFDDEQPEPQAFVMVSETTSSTSTLDLSYLVWTVT